LADQVATSCAKGGSHRNFAAADIRTRQQKIDDVGTRDEEDHTHRTEQHE
jgi:hypothetical protein